MRERTDEYACPGAFQHAPSFIASFDVRLRRINPNGINNWVGHIPFAFDLVARLRPRLAVELGAHYGESYFAICQAVEERARQRLPCGGYVAGR
jgi:hypothetical protein